MQEKRDVILVYPDARVRKFYAALMQANSLLRLNNFSIGLFFFVPLGKCCSMSGAKS